MIRQGVRKVQRTRSADACVRRNTSSRQAMRAPGQSLATLQRSLGNQAFQRMLRASHIQTKLNVSSPGDHSEREADQVAAQVMRMPAPRSIQPAAPALQRKCAPCAAGQKPCPKCAEEKTAQRTPLISRVRSFVQRRVAPPTSADEKKKETPVMRRASPLLQESDHRKKETEGLQRKPLKPGPNKPLKEEDDHGAERRALDQVETTMSATKGGGQSLPDNVRDHMESAIGADFSDVKVHTGPSAVQMNQDLGAKAFTHGKDVYFSRNAYNPQSGAGRELLAHELTHVVQQTGGEVQTKARPEVEKDKDKDKVKQVSKKEMVQRNPDVTAVNGPGEMPAGLGRRVTLRATAPRGTAVNWSITAGAATGAVLGGGTGLTNTLTAPAASTGGVVTVQATDAAGQAVAAPTHNITLVEIQQPTFALAPPPPASLFGVAFPPNTVEASVCGNNATAAAVQNPAGRPATWSIVGNRRGATIDPATGVITPSVTQTGNIVVRLTDNALPAARNQQTLTIRAHPTQITRTIRTGPTGPYGSVYDHIFQSSGGPLNGVDVSERVFCGNDPFGICGAFLPVVPGLPNVWTVNAANRMIGDFMLTPAAAIDVNRFLPSPPRPGLPQHFTSPQILYWRSEQCGQFVPFQNVPIDFILRRRAAGGFETVTTNNRVASPAEVYGPPSPALAAAAAPAASACPPGERLSNVRFNPTPIGADGSALTTTAASVTVQPGGNLVTWSLPPAPSNLGAAIVAQGNPALLSAGNVAGQVVVRVAMTGNAACFAEGRLRLQEVEIGPGMTFSPATVRHGGTTRARVSTKPGNRVVQWSIQGAALGSVIVRNADNSATITAGAQAGRITIRATDDRDVTKFSEASLVIT